MVGKPCSCSKRIKNGECALITLISTNTALKDPFSLPWIDKVVDSTTNYELLSFLDCYSGYHQISLKEDAQIKTSFITPFGAYCYTTMSFGLKNARVTYQRAM